MAKKIVFFDDHTMVRQGLSSWFASHSDFSVEGSAGTVEEAISLIDSLSKSSGNEKIIIVTDLSFSNEEKSGYDILDYIKKNAPNMLPVVYSSFYGGGYITMACEKGAQAFVSKNSGEGQLLKAVEYILAGKTFIQGDLVNDMLSVRDMYRILTKKELELLENLSENLSREDIAEKMNISVRTVENYLSRIYDKTYTKNTIELLERMGRRFV